MELLLAISIGFVGSAHCLSMCGPLLLLFNFGNKTSKGKWLALLYHLFRMGAYALLGAAVGGLMNSFQFFGLSQWVSIVTGSIFLIIGLTQLIVFKSAKKVSLVSSLFQKIYGKTLNSTSGYGKVMAAGFLNGFLPCGLVYVALSGAFLSENSAEGALYMLSFGLGTLPAMYLVSLFSDWIKNKLLNFRMRWLIPSVYLLTGTLLLLRGLNLGIPYLSPQLDQPSHKMSCCHAK